MDKIEPVKDSISHSVDNIIDAIRSVRNNLVKELLKDNELQGYYKTYFNKDLTNIKKEFIRRELKELLIAPVDLAHYAGLINLIKETNSSSLVEGNSKYFQTDIQRIVSKYEH